MGLNNKNILGVKISISNELKVLEEVRKYLKTRIKNHESRIMNKLKPMVIFTPNPEIINYAQKDKEFKKIVNSAQINIPDGSGVTWALARKYGIKLRPIPGVELMKSLIELSASERFRIGVIGGRETLAVDVTERLRKTYKNLTFSVLDCPVVTIKNNDINIDGYQNTKYFQKIAKKLDSKKIDILFVALGFPKQEYFINRIMNNEFGIMNKRPIVMMGVGGSLDYISGN